MTGYPGLEVALALRVNRRARERIVVELHPQASHRQHRELGAFVRYCVFRLEREFGELRWLVRIVPIPNGFASSVAVNDETLIVEARGSGFDGALAAWEALYKVEEALRQARAHNSGSGFLFEG